MFIDLVPNRNSPPAILLRESFREGSQVKKRTIANLSSWPATRIEVFRRLLRAVNWTPSRFKNCSKGPSSACSSS